MRDRVVRDPIYGYVSVSPVAPLVDHVLCQRLRRVSQTSLTSYIYPSATGTRFEHGLGAMHLAGLAWDAAWENARPEVQRSFMTAAWGDRTVRLDELREEDPDNPDAVARDVIRTAISSAALLHDVGHSPYSHALEPFYDRSITPMLGDGQLARERRTRRGAFHEFAGRVLARDVCRSLEGPLRRLTTAILESRPMDESWVGALKSVVAGEVDVDRLDYLMRDGQRAGTEFGAIDWNRLIRSLELHGRIDTGFRIAPGVAALSAVETLLVQRAQQYKWITFHTRVVGSNLALKRAIGLLEALAHDPAMVQTNGDVVALSAMFGPMRPSINYVSPTAEDLALLTHGSLGSDEETLVSSPPEPPGQLAIDRDSEGALDALTPGHIRRHVQAAADDAFVSTALHRGYLVAESLLDERRALERETAATLEKFRSYAGAALFRAKTFIPAWKTIDEYHGLAREMRDDLVASANTVAGTIESALLGDAGEKLAREARLAASRLTENSVVGLNHLVTELLTKEDLRTELVERLQEHEGGFDVPGSWDLEYTEFTPVKGGRAMPVVYRDTRRIRVSELSPLVRELATVEAERNRLAAFFFVTDSVGVATWSSAELRKSRRQLREDFAAVFPNFVVDVWPGFLLASGRRRREEKDPDDAS